LDRERIITIAIVIGIFGGLVGGPILSLADYYAPPEKRFWTFIIRVHRFWLPHSYGGLGQIKKEEKISTT
jgi:hypothetical protein